MKKLPTTLTVPSRTFSVWLTSAPPPEASVPALGKLCAGDAPGARRELEGSLRDLPSGEARAQVLLELGSVLWNQGEPEAGLTLLGQALIEADVPALQARIHTRISSMTDDFEVAAEHAEVALRLIDEREDPLVYSFALHNLARAKFYAGRGADHALPVRRQTRRYG